MKSYLVLFFTLLSCMLFAQQTDKSVQLTGNNRLEVAGTVLGGGESGQAASGMSFTLVNRLSCSSSNPDRPKWCLLLEIEFARIGIRKDPWNGDFGPIIINTPQPVPDPFLWDDFSLTELEIGPSTFFIPRVGMEFSLSDRVSLTPSVGGGFQYVAANTTQIDGLGTFKTTDSTNPLLTFGATARYGISNTLVAKVGVQGVTSFESNLDVIGPNGSIATFGGMSMFTPMISAGIGVNFN